MRAMQVDVDVFRRLGPVRDVPINGAPSFTSEALYKWRELNSTSHFLEAAAAIQPFIESLPQLVHHAQQVRVYPDLASLIPMSLHQSSWKGITWACIVCCMLPLACCLVWKASKQSATIM